MVVGSKDSNPISRTMVFVCMKRDGKKAIYFSVD